MKDFKNDSASTLSRFGRDKRERTATVTSERVERRPGSQRDAADSDHSGYRKQEGRASYNPNFTADNRPVDGDRPRRSFGDKPSYGDKPYGDRKFGDKPGFKKFGDKPYGERKSFGDRPSYGDRENSEGGERRSYGDKPYGDRKFGDKPGFKKFGDKPYGERKSFGDRPSYGDRDNSEGGERRPYGEKKSFGNKPYGDRKFGDKPGFKKFGDKPSYGDRDRKFGDKPYGERKSFGDRPSYGNRDNSEGGERRPYGDKPYGERKSFGDKPYGDRKFGDKPGFKKFGDKPYGERKSFGDRPSYGNRDNSEGGERRSYGDKPYGERKSFGDRPSYGNRDNSEGGERRPYGDKPYGERKSFGDKPYGDRKFGDKPGYNKFGAKPGFKRDFRSDDKPANYPKYDPNKQTGEMRLNRFIAQSGLCSRREADDYIQAGLVSVNGTIVTELGSKVMPTDEVKFNDSRVEGEKKVYLVLNKPKGFVTSLDDPHADKTVMDLVKGACQERIYPVGRLDKNSLGLLLFTNDGDLTKQLTHPSYKKKKIYQVSLDKALERADMDSIAQGITLEDGEIFADEVAYVKDNKKEIGVEIHSGRNRIVRRIFEHLGYTVTKLDRVYYAGLTKKNLKRGEWRFLTREEVERLKSGQYE